MESLEEIIEKTKDVRELKRALNVKMLQEGIEAASISELLNVSVQYVSKWKIRYEAKGAAGLALAYGGSESYLSETQRQAVLSWINEQESVSLEQLVDYLEVEYDLVYKSKQSYYDLLTAGGMSYHKSEKKNPKRDEVQVLTRREEVKKNWQRSGQRSFVRT